MKRTGQLRTIVGDERVEAALKKRKVPREKL